MRLPPGSVPWLLRHELRLAWRRSRLGRWAVPAIIAGGLVVLFMQAIGLWFAQLLIEAHVSEPALLAGVSALLAFSGLLMLSQALRIAVEALYERQDLDWLLTSPVPFRRLLAVRIAGMAVQVAAVWLVIVVGPLANGLAFRGRPAALATYPVLLALALLATTTGSAAAIQVVSRLGLRRGRSLVNGLALALGAATFLASQARNLLSPAEIETALQGLSLGDGSGLQWLPARAMLGAPGPLLAVLAISLGTAALAAWRLELQFTRGLAHDPTTPRQHGPATAAMPRFGPGLRRVLLRKEFRLLRRSPGLLGKALFQSIYLLPAVFALLRGAAGELPVMAVAAIVFLTGEIARLLISAAISGDEAAELVKTAPVPPRAVRWAKLLAAGLSLAVLLATPVLVTAIGRPGLLPALLAGLVGVAISAMLLAMAHPAAPRAGELGGGRIPLSGSDWLNLAVSGLWAATTWGMAS